MKCVNHIQGQQQRQQNIKIFDGSTHLELFDKKAAVEILTKKFTRKHLQ